MDILQEKYVYLISSKLPKFTIKSKRPLVVNFRCVLCGDSKRNKNKARGFILDKQGKYFYCCHNGCNARPFEIFLRKFDYNLFEQYQREKAKAKFAKDIQTDPDFNSEMKDVDFGILEYTSDPRFEAVRSIDKCKPDNIARKFITARNIPEQFWSVLYHCTAFKQWTNLWVKNKFDKDSIKRGDYDAVIIPILDQTNQKLIGFQGRILNGPKDLRYITISLVGNANLIYNVGMIDHSKRVFVTEGPFDSLFLPNSIAAMGGSIHTSLNKLVNDNKTNFIIVYDNEPRSKFNVQHIQQAIEAGYSVLIWPSNIEPKDVNAVVNDWKLRDPNLTTSQACDQITKLIEDNTYYGLNALLQLNDWKRV